MAIHENELRPVILESGIEVKPVYGPEDIAGLDLEQTIGQPGEYPFTRGIHRHMYRARPWTMRQYTGFGSPDETNRRFHFLIEHGQNALNVAFDLPTQMGLDSDDPLAEGEVGRVGMAVDTLRDMEVAFKDIPIDQISVSLTVNAVTPVILAMYLSMAEKYGMPRGQVRGTTQNDILKEYIGRGAWIFPVEPSLRLTGDTMEFCAKEAPHYYPVSVCGYHIRESGATPAQEIAYAYGIAKAYIQEVIGRGLGVDDFAGRISFNFNIYGNLWEQVAKFRAARRLWARLMKEEFGAKKASTMQMKMIAGGGSGLTIEEPENNIVRGAYYALIAALSGTQTSALCCYDEAYTIPTPKAQLISLRTMQILAEEIGLSDTVDPLAGSYYIERLTAEMEQRIVVEMRQVDQEWGGIVQAVSAGLIQQKVARQAYEYERKLQRGEIVKVGVNKYRVEENDEKPPEVELHPYRTEARDEQLQRLAQVKQARNAVEVEAALNEVRDVCRRKQNVMPAMMRAVQAYCTLGEIIEVMKQVLGEFKEPVRF